MTADKLSRAPLHSPLTEEEELLEAVVKVYIDHILNNLPAMTAKLKQIQRFTETGWPNRGAIHEPLLQFWPDRSDLLITEGLLLKGKRLVIPENMRTEMLEKLHHGHQGITKCLAQQSILWLGLSKQITDMVKNCETCVKEAQS